MLHKLRQTQRDGHKTENMNAGGGGGFFNRLNPWGAGGVVPRGVIKAVATAAGMAVTLDPTVLEEDEEVSPLRTRQSMTSPTTTGLCTGKGNTPNVMRSARLNTKPVGTLYSIRKALRPRTTTPGDLCPRLKLRGTSNKAGDYTPQLLTCRGLKASRVSQSPTDLPGVGKWEGRRCFEAHKGIHPLPDLPGMETSLCPPRRRSQCRQHNREGLKLRV